MPTIRAFCSVCNKDFTESLTESRDNYDAAEKKARGRAGSHMWGKHLADNPTWEEMSKAAWDALVQQLRVEASGVEESSEGQPSQREIPPPRSLGGPEPGVAVAQQDFLSQSLQGQRSALAASTVPEPGEEPASAEGAPVEDPTRPRFPKGNPFGIKPVAGVMPPPPPGGLPRGPTSRGLGQEARRRGRSRRSGSCRRGRRSPKGSGGPQRGPTQPGLLLLGLRSTGSSRSSPEGGPGARSRSACCRHGRVLAWIPTTLRGLLAAHGENARDLLALAGDDGRRRRPSRHGEALAADEEGGLLHQSPRAGTPRGPGPSRSRSACCATRGQPTSRCCCRPSCGRCRRSSSGQRWCSSWKSGAAERPSDGRAGGRERGSPRDDQERGSC